MTTIGQPSESPKPRSANPWIVAAAVIGLIVVAIAVYVLFIRPQPLDTVPIESQLEESPEFLQSLPFNAVERVECPDDVEVEEGGEFQCTVYGPRGRSTVIDLVQLDTEGSVDIVFND